MNYRQYLQSTLWRKRRYAAIERAKGQCGNCKDRVTRLEVHHKTYERLGNEKPSDLIALCPSCHWEFDQVRKGKELPPEIKLPDYPFEPKVIGDGKFLWRHLPKVNRRQGNMPK